MFKSLRLRLTVGYLAFFSILSGLFCFLVYGAFARALELRVDEMLRSQADTAAALAREEIEEQPGDAKRAFQGVIADIQPHGSVIAILEGTEILAASGDLPVEGIRRQAARILEAAADDVAWGLPRWGSDGSRAAAHRFTLAGRKFIVIALVPLDSLAQQLGVLRETFWFAVPPLLALAALGGYLLTRRGLAPLGVMAAQSRSISSQNLMQRLEIGHAAEELAILAASFNELLSRLDQSFESVRRLVQDAAHEIRTPLAVIRGEADVALSQERSPSEYRESLSAIQEESRRLSRLVEDLLNLARADGGHVHLRMEELYLNDLLAECCRAIQPLAAVRNINLECMATEDVVFHGDEELLRRMVLNLLDNAIRYTPAGGSVSATLAVEGHNIRIRVTDTGVGITPEEASHVFERFYRADKARARDRGGFGLGLSIVKWIAESHKGIVEMASQPGSGSTFTVRFAR
jgi:heavy metal sensor kinase